MRNLFRLGVSLYVISVSFVALVTGSAWLQDPPSRSAAWNYQIQTPVNYNYMNLNCGGKKVKIEDDGSRNCGLCGDDFEIQPPRPNERGGKYANPIVRTRYYEAGQTAEITIWNNLPGAPGFYEFRLCTDALNASQACLDEHLLTILDFGSTSMTVPSQQGVNMIHLQLPVGVTCEYCLLQWRFSKGDNGCNSNNWCRLGRTEYYNCADVTIGRVGQPKPTYIQDPTYSDADYGSAYDAMTTLVTRPGGGRFETTTPSSGSLGRTTARPPQVPVFTIPTLPPNFPTQNPAVTVAPPFGQVTERLVVDASGNQIGTVLSGTNGITASSTNNNRQLLLLLGLLPLIGAVALRNGNRIPPAAIGQGGPGYVVAGPPVSQYYLGTGIGFGNFGPGVLPVGFGPRRFRRSVDGESETDAEEITHVQTRSVKEMDMDTSAKSETITDDLKDVRPQVRLARDTGSEYGHTDNEYGNTNNQASQWQTIGGTPVRGFQGPNSGNQASGFGNQGDTGSEYGHADNEYGNTNNQASQWSTAGGNQARGFRNQGRNIGNQGPNAGGATFPAQSATGRRRFQNRNRNLNGGGSLVNIRNGQGRFGQDARSQILSQNDDANGRQTGNTGRKRILTTLSRNNIGADLDGLRRVVDMDRGFRTFRANRNPLARTLSRGRMPSAHDWYMTFMTKSTNQGEAS